jgi:radical SAM protein with 4Fe4S-binding SPASM domain
MTTNGTILRDRDIELLRESSLKRLTVSVDGYDQHSSDARRPGTSFDALLANIRRLVEETGLDIALKCTFTVDTRPETLERIVLLADALGASATKFNFERDLASPHRKASRDESIRYFSLWQSLLKIARASRTTVICNQRNPLVLSGPLMSNLVGWGCPAGRDLMYVNPYGEAKGCALLGEEFRAGRYPAASVIEMWRGGSGIVKLRASDINEKCGTCEFLATCRGGCTQRRVLNGGLDAPDYYCFADVADEFSEVRPNERARNVYVERYDLAHL